MAVVWSAEVSHVTRAGKIRLDHGVVFAAQAVRRTWSVTGVAISVTVVTVLQRVIVVSVSTTTVAYSTGERL